MGASKDAPVSCNTGKANLVQLTTQRLASQCTDPIPEHQIESFTVDHIPAAVSTFEPDPDDLCRYCLTLANILNSHNFSAMEEKALTGLLFELTGHFADELRTPRFVRTAITV